MQNPEFKDCVVIGAGPAGMTSIDGLYAIGDVVSALNQISIGVGHAAVAATSIHNVLPRNLR